MTLGTAVREVTQVSRPSPAPSSRAEISTFAAGALAAFYLATSIYIAAHRLYWFDELFIVRFAQMPNLATMWDALAHASDTMPPGYHLVMRGVTRALGYSEIATILNFGLRANLRASELKTRPSGPSSSFCSTGIESMGPGGRFLSRKPTKNGRRTLPGLQTISGYPLPNGEGVVWKN